MANAFDGNANLPNPFPSVVDFKKDVWDFRTAQTKAATGAKGTAAARNAAKKKVKKNILQWKTYVQQVVDARSDPAVGASIIASAYMKDRQPRTARSKDELTATNTGNSGEVQLDAKAVKGALITSGSTAPTRRTG